MPKKSKQVSGKNGNKQSEIEPIQSRQRGYLVRFPDREAENRAILILGQVGLPYSGYPDEQYGVQYGLMNQHIEALHREEIPYEVVA